MVCIAILFIIDNSQCERDFSEMNLIMGKFQYWMDHEVLRDRLWWHKMKKLLSKEGKWEEAVNRIGHEWLKGTNTKTGRRHAHTAAAPIDEVAAFVEAAHAAAAAQREAEEQVRAAEGQELEIDFVSV